jgi:hypothetical protein
MAGFFSNRPARARGGAPEGGRAPRDLRAKPVTLPTESKSYRLLAWAAFSFSRDTQLGFPNPNAPIPSSAPAFAWWRGVVFPAFRRTSRRASERVCRECAGLERDGTVGARVCLHSASSSALNPGCPPCVGRTPKARRPRAGAGLPQVNKRPS